MLTMPRRVHVQQLAAGRIEMDQRNSHYLRDVLRMKIGSELELFDDSGQTAAGRVAEITSDAVIVEADSPRSAVPVGFQWTIASAVPKSNRADWMVEKLSEFGAAGWIPLITTRSVVHPEASNKSQRWQRIAEESARQCGRSGVMRIEPLTPLEELFRRCATPPAIGLCLHPGSTPVSQTLANLSPTQHPIFLVGPEGGWTDAELQNMQSAGIGQFALAATILRIETAAIAVAAIAQMKR
jgi:16S rRNA (uracil1498-N3)-methyltransferase